MRTSTVRLTVAPSNAYTLIRLLAWLKLKRYKIARDDEMSPEWRTELAVSGPWVVMHAYHQKPTRRQRLVGIEEIRKEPILSMMSEGGCVPIHQDYETEIPKGCYLLIRERRKWVQ
jgi:hypothetical protein